MLTPVPVAPLSPSCVSSTGIRDISASTGTRDISASTGTRLVVSAQSTDESDSLDGCKDFSKPRLTGLFQFGNTEAIKQKVREHQDRPQYNVHTLYHEDGICPKIARHPVFESVTLSVIVANALWIWVDTDFNTAETLLEAKPVFVVADIMFFIYFSVELSIRFCAFKRKIDCCKDAWFVFDATLVILYLFDPFVIAMMAVASGGGGIDLPTSILRLLRLARLTRLVRMLRSLPELMIMVKGMMTASASVGYTLGLLLLITYIFAIALTQLSVNTNFRERYFSSVHVSMYSLIIYGTFLDALSDFCDEISEESLLCLVITAIYIALASMTVLNMLIGVLCEVISAVALEEKESMMVDKVNEKFGLIVEGLDANSNGKISWNEFQKIITIDEALHALKSVNVDALGMIDMAEDVFFQDGQQKELTFEQFMNLILDLRGGQQATLKDVMSLGKRFNSKFRVIHEEMKEMNKKLDQLLVTARHPA